jgi:hypothetical protein
MKVNCFQAGKLKDRRVEPFYLNETRSYTPRLHQPFKLSKVDSNRMDRIKRKNLISGSLIHGINEPLNQSLLILSIPVNFFASETSHAGRLFDG